MYDKNRYYWLVRLYVIFFMYKDRHWQSLEIQRGLYLQSRRQKWWQERVWNNYVILPQGVPVKSGQTFNDLVSLIDFLTLMIYTLQWILC